MLAVVPSVKISSGIMSVMRQAGAHGGAGSVVGALWSCPGWLGLVAAGIVNGP